MKFTVEMKDPDALFEAIEEAVRTKRAVNSGGAL